MKADWKEFIKKIGIKDLDLEDLAIIGETDKCYIGEVCLEDFLINDKVQWEVSGEDLIIDIDGETYELEDNEDLHSVYVLIDKQSNKIGSKIYYELEDIEGIEEIYEEGGEENEDED